MSFNFNLNPQQFACAGTVEACSGISKPFGDFGGMVQEAVKDVTKSPDKYLDAGKDVVNFFTRHFGDEGGQVRGMEAEGAIGIPRQMQNAGRPHRGVLGAMMAGQDQSLTNPMKPFQQITGILRPYAGSGALPYGHLRVFPSPTT